jgi:hypothetical protein
LARQGKNNIVKLKWTNKWLNDKNYFYF